MTDTTKNDRNEPGNLQNTRPTIGLLTNHFGTSVREMQWLGVVDAAREQAANLFSFAGQPLRAPTGFDAQANVLFELIDAEQLDGLVIYTDNLNWYISPQEMEAFCKQYQPLPVVSVGAAFEKIPSVLLDNYQGMRENIIHLIEEHGYRRIAFLRGPEGPPWAEERYRAYHETMADYGLLDPNLITPPEADWSNRTKSTVLLDLLSKERGVDFDVVVACDDVVAIEMAAALRARGRQVPGDVAVTGYDDMVEAKTATPPLTTIRQPFGEIGRRAVEILLARIQNKPVTDLTTVPTKLVVRQSCGCTSKAVAEADPGIIVEEKAASVAAQRERILSEVEQAIGPDWENVKAEQVAKLFDGFTAEVEDPSTATFVPTFDEILTHTVSTGADATMWNKTLSLLRRHTLPYAGNKKTLSKMENLWQQARVLLGEIVERSGAQQLVHLEHKTERLDEIGQALISTFDVSELMDILAERLPRLNIPGAYLSLYESPKKSTEWSRLMLAYNGRDRVETKSDEARFPSRYLVPKKHLPQGRQFSFVVEPLYFRDNQLGIVLFEMGPRAGKVYETLRGEVSSALRGALLMQERQQAEAALEKAYAEVEKQVKERTRELQEETANREKLQQEVIDTQKRLIRELSTPVIPIMDQVIVMPLIGSIDSLRAGDITRSLLAGISTHKAKMVILDVTGVPLVDSGVANHLNKTIQAARLKGADTIMTGISSAVAETIVDLGIDWSGIKAASDLQTGLRLALTTIRIKN